MIDIFLELRYTLCDAFQLIHRIKRARNDERVLRSSSFSEIRMLSRRGGEAKKKEGVWKIKILDFISRPLLLQTELENVPRYGNVSLLRPSVDTPS